MDPHQRKIIAAFTATYIIWGSTYLAMSVMAETMAPLTAAALRHTLAGVFMLLIAAGMGKQIPMKASDWAGPAYLGGIFLAAGNGVATWAVHRIPSGLATLIVASNPMMLALWQRFGPGGKPLKKRLWLGLAVGFAGLAWLLEPQFHGSASTAGVLGMIWASFCWAWGSVASAKVRQPADAMVACGMQMLSGGMILLVAGFAFEGSSAIKFNGASLRSLWALAYLAIFGSMVAYLCFFWLLRQVKPEIVATNTFVNPVVAVILGWWILSEALDARTIAASLLVLGAVALIVSSKKN